MLQEIFRIPFLDIPIYGYGLMLVIGFLLATQLARFLARRSAVDPEVFVTAGLVALISGVAGARLSHILENLGEFTNGSLTQNLWKMVNIRSGGLTYYGGFITATACTIGYGLYVKAPIKRGMDIIAPCLMIGLAFGRIGCFLNGCCYGAECDIKWLGVQFPYYSNAYIDEWQHGKLKQPVPEELLVPIPDSTDGSAKLLEPPLVERNSLAKNAAAQTGSNLLHPTQIYSAITAFMLAGILTAYYTLPHAAGRVFALMLMLEGGTRFLLEMIRTEPAVVGPESGAHSSLLQSLPNMSLSMVIGLGLVAAGLAMWFAVSGPPDELAYQGDTDSTPAIA
ncbi:MAG TPA: prolipoprotein diacylglyceryl transferase [Roseimicrobium sp.]|nr:prolipoprotein diacylglyceryl transferase [Roseimicrobium sp.]